MAAGLTQSQANIANANAAQAASTGAMISGVGNMAGAVIGAGGFAKKPLDTAIGVAPVQSEGFTSTPDPSGNFLDNRAVTEDIVFP